jgi:hypothetical protein
MATEQGQLTNLGFTATEITATFQNTGTTTITINEVWVNGVKQTGVSPTVPITVDGNSQQAIVITYTVVSGYQYEVKLVSAKGNAFLRTGVAPA